MTNERDQPGVKRYHAPWGPVEFVAASDFDSAVACLREIANEDYRGNRSPASVKAYHWLREHGLEEK